MVSAGEGAHLCVRCETSDKEIVLTVLNSVGCITRRGDGLGQKNVEAVVRKHKGTVHFIQKDDEYYSRVVLRK